VIPLQYYLRAPVRLEQGPDSRWRVVCQSPLTVLTVNEAAARLLKRAGGGATVSDLATEFSLPEERVLSLCERFRRRAILEVGRAPVGPGFEPAVTVIVPTRDRARDLDECLGALDHLVYPRSRLDVVVVDDGSDDPSGLAAVVGRHGARLLINDHNRGPSYSRNRAAAEASGEIIAFIDSDCVASPTWLQELVPFFAWDSVGAVGGRTMSYYLESRLDRYEETASPLDMGRYLRFEEQEADTFYVPSCNLLVRRATYLGLGGLREDLRMGEDVDLCWRLREQGHYLVYTPEGVVRHKHRNELGSMLRRRAGYGSSEAVLYGLHPEKRKTFPWEPVPLATVALLSVGVLARRPWMLGSAMLPALGEVARRNRHLRENGIDVPAGQVVLSVARGHLSMLYFVYFHLVRYYLGPLAAAGVLSRGMRRLAVLAGLYSATVGYVTKRPRLDFLTYLGYYLAEHTAYQAGVIAGCARAGSLRPYRLAVKKSRTAACEPPRPSWRLQPLRGWSHGQTDEVSS
jgi:mycofactocin system glycosyltransferase